MFSHPSFDALVQRLGRGDEQIEWDGAVVYCPNHEKGKGHNPSLKVRLDNGKLLVSCRAGCDRLDVLHAINEQDWNGWVNDLDVATQVHKRPRTHDDERRMKDFIEDCHKEMRMSRQRDVHDKVKAQYGLDELNIRSLKLGVWTPANPSSLRPGGNEGGRYLIIPFADGCGYRARALDGQNINKTGPEGSIEWTQSGFLGAARTTSLIITEGETDGLAAIANGITPYVITGAGRGLSQKDIKNIIGGKFSRIFIAADGDNSGREAGQKRRRALKEAGGLDIDAILYSVEFGDGEDLRSFSASLTNTDLLSALIGVANPFSSEDFSTLSERERAKALLDKLAGNLYFDSSMGIWYEYVPALGIWTVSRNTNWPTSIDDMINSSAPVIGPVMWQKIDTVGFRKTLMTVARNDPRFLRETNEFDRAGLNMVATASGLLEVETGMLHDNPREYMLTKVAPCDFNPHASSSRWEDLVYQMSQEDDTLAEVLQCALGSTLIGIPTSKIFVFYGEGNNGKSVILRLVSNLIGNYAISVQEDALAPTAGNAGRFSSRASMSGKRLVHVEELAPGHTIDDSFLKALCDGGKIDAKVMGGNMFSFVSEATPIITTNNEPNFSSFDGGIARRLVAVPFDHQYPNVGYIGGENLNEVFAPGTQEGEGAFLWLVDGARKCIEAQGFPQINSSRVTELTEEIAEAKDSIKAFVQVSLEREEEGRIYFNQLYSEYEKFCRMRGLQPFGQATFTRRFKHIVQPKTFRVSDGRGVIGYRIRQTMIGDMF